MRTQVGIVGAGPAGLLLSHLLHLEGIESVVIEARSRAYVEERVRAGVLEQGSVDLLNASGVGERMRKEGLTHEGIELLFNHQRHRINFRDLTGGKCVTVYGQQEVVKDLIEARLMSGGEIVFEAQDVAVQGLESERPSIEFREGERTHRLECDFIAGCDGFHGICRPAIASALRFYEREYPSAWLGILAQAKPASEELIYARHEHGFALLSMRSPAVTRLYLQCAPDEDLANWPDSRIWEELQIRLHSGGGFRVEEGPILQKGITPMRSFVAEPMQSGRLFLAGDAAHIVPPTGAKGMNLAMADVSVLARALRSHYAHGNQQQLAAYSQTCLRRVWRVQHFSYWMTSLFHRADNAFEFRRQTAELNGLVSSRAAAQYLAENYIGLPLDPP